MGGAGVDGARVWWYLRTVTPSTRADARLVSGDLPGFTSFVTGADAVVQRIKFRILTHRGEWFADPRVGLPWMEWVRRKPLPLPIIHATVREEIARTPGVTRILHSEATFDGEARRVSIRVQAEIARSVVEIEYLMQSAEYGNVSPYVIWRTLGRGE